jgi:malonyl CoA-acyl carrier protein transacylase
MNVKINILGVNKDRTELRVLVDPSKSEVESEVLSLLNMLGRSSHAIIGMNKKLYAAYHKLREESEREITSYVITQIKYHPHMRKVVDA